MVTLIILLAGCAGTREGTSEGAKGNSSDAAHPAVSTSTGAIAGVVVDEAIRPLANVSVSLEAAELVALTDAAGLFAFEGLAPGSYVLTANATAGFLAAQTTVAVQAGKVAKTRIVLPTDPTPRPHHTTLSFDGFEEAGDGHFSWTVDYVQALINQSLVRTCTCYFVIEPEGPVETFVIEAVWQDSIPSPAGPTDYYWGIDTGDAMNAESGHFASPGRTAVAGEAYDNAAHIGVGVYTTEEWVTFQQKFEVFVTLFYLTAAPDGWSFVAGDE